MEDWNVSPFKVFTGGLAREGSDPLDPPKLLAYVGHNKFRKL
jgi:hypothetical protein